MRSESDYANMLIFGTPLPPQEDLTIPLPDGFYVCMSCGVVNNYWKYECESCETKGEEDFEKRHEEN